MIRRTLLTALGCAILAAMSVTAILAAGDEKGDRVRDREAPKAAAEKKESRDREKPEADRPGRPEPANPDEQAILELMGDPMRCGIFAVHQIKEMADQTKEYGPAMEALEHVAHEAEEPPVRRAALFVLAEIHKARGNPAEAMHALARICTPPEGRPGPGRVLMRLPGPDKAPIPGKVEEKKGIDFDILIDRARVGGVGGEAHGEIIIVGPDGKMEKREFRFPFGKGVFQLPGARLDVEKAPPHSEDARRERGEQELRERREREEMERRESEERRRQEAGPPEELLRRQREEIEKLQVHAREMMEEARREIEQRFQRVAGAVEKGQADVGRLAEQLEQMARRMQQMEREVERRLNELSERLRERPGEGDRERERRRPEPQPGRERTETNLEL